MNPDDLIAAVRRAFAPSPNQQRTERILQSPMADSLWATMNNDRPNAGSHSNRRTIVTRLGEALQGQSGRNDVHSYYTPATESIALTDKVQSSLNADGRRTLIHEAAHHADNLRPGVSFLDKRFDFPNMSSDAARQLPLAERKARGRVDGYYRTNPAEGFAQAFTSAYQFLTGPRSRPLNGARWDRETAMRRLADMEGRTPGAGEILRDLLKKDIFRGHPMGEFVR